MGVGGGGEEEGGGREGRGIFSVGKHSRLEDKAGRLLTLLNNPSLN
jgi:hypothetical protein